jgi:hypothetical protein
MRSVRDRRLPEPFRAWINRAEPLPPGVTVLPRTINVSLAVMVLIFPGMAFVGMGVAFIALFVPTGGLQGVGGLVFLALWSTISFGVPLWLVHRLWRTIGARRDQAAGTLRQGVLVGPEGVLVRLTPNRCYVIPMDRFVTAKEWSGGGDSGTDWLRIETRDGPIDFTADHFTIGAAGVNQAVAAVRRRPAARRGPGTPGRAKAAGPSAGGPPRPWSFVVGLILATLAVFVSEATVREVLIALHRGDYVRDELVVEGLQHDPASLYGQIASTGESVTAPISVAGPDQLDRFRHMQPEGGLKGYRVPVWYLPKASPWLWGASDRVLDVWESGDRFAAWRAAAAVNAALAVVSVVLIRRGLKHLPPVP